MIHFIGANKLHRLQCFKHDDVIKWKHFPRYWPFVRGIHRSPVKSPHKGECHGALMFSFVCVWINDWVNNREAGDFGSHRAHYDVTVMIKIDRAKSHKYIPTFSGQIMDGLTLYDLSHDIWDLPFTWVNIHCWRMALFWWALIFTHL